VSIHSFASSDQLIAKAAVDFQSVALELLATKPIIRVLLTGGTLGIEFVSAISKLSLDWSKIWLMFSDERFVGLEHADRNEFQAITVWPGLSKRLTRFPSDGVDLDIAREELNEKLITQLGPIEEHSAVFDITVLGMGPDAHVASLFPAHDAQGEWVVAEPNSPKPPSQRLSLSYRALNRSEMVWFLVAGESKLWAVQRSMDPNGELPASKVRGLRETAWYLDKKITDAL
jgi:6-phosphogluconolactonase